MSTLRYRNRPAPYELEPAMQMLEREKEGFAVDFITGRAYARGYNGFQPKDINGFLNYASPSPKYVMSDDGLLVLGTTIRCDHDAERNPLGVLIEGQRANILWRSEEFGHNVWFRSQSTIEENVAIAPDGTLTADRLNIVAVQNNLAQIRTGLSGSTTYTLSVWARGAGQVLAMKALRHTGVSYVTETFPLSGNWQRFSVTFTTDPEISGNTILCVHDSRNMPGASVLGAIDVWGAQLEVGAFPTSYIKTEGSQVTRAADIISLATSAFPFRQAGGTLIADFTPNYADNNVAEEFGPFRLATLTAQQIAARLTTSGSRSGEPQFILRGSLQYISAGPIHALPPPGGIRQKWAMSYDTTVLRAVYNGIPTLTEPDLTESTLPSPSALYFGSWGANAHINGHMRSLVYIPRLMSAEELNEWTTI